MVKLGNERVLKFAVSSVPRIIYKKLEKNSTADVLFKSHGLYWESILAITPFYYYATTHSLILGFRSGCSVITKL